MTRTTLIRALAVLGFVALSPTVRADLNSQTITLDLEKGTVSPASPTINIRANPAVVLDIVPFKCKCDIKPSEGPEKNEFLGLDATQTPPNSNAVVFNFKKNDKITATPTGAQSWDITHPGHGVYSIEVSPRGNQAGCGSAQSYYVIIYVDSAVYELNWSAGFGITSLRDTRLRLDPITGDDKHLAIVENGHQGIPANALVLAHYCYAKPGFLGALCVSSGLGTDVPSSGVLLFLGPSLRFRPIDNANSFYLTVGGVYGPRKVLNDDYAGRTNPIVPVGTSTSSLLSTRYGMGWGVSLSYGFIDAKDKFKGVFSGGGKSSEQAKSTGQK